MLSLYYSPGACSLGPHILVTELGLTCELKCVAIAKSEHATPAYKTINPRMRVPALVVDDGIVTEGPAIMLYLGSLLPDAGLLPANGSLQFGKCIEWLTWIASTLHVSYAQLWRPQRFVPMGDDAQAISKHARDNILKQNLEVESLLKGPWLLGETHSVADCYLLAFYRWGTRIGLSMQVAYPRWTAWKERMLERPAVQRALDEEGIGRTWRAD